MSKIAIKIAKNTVKSKPAKKYQKYKLVSPTGARLTVSNIDAFCKDVFGVTKSGRGRYVSSFIELKNGTRTQKEVMGWKLC